VAVSPQAGPLPTAARLWPALTRAQRRPEPLEGLDRAAAQLRGRVVRRGVSRAEWRRVRAIADRAAALRDASEAELDAAIARVRESAPRAAAAAPASDEAFAVIACVVERGLGLRLHDVQLAGQLVLDAGRVAEMATGEGKTITAIAPAALAAFCGRGCHVVTVNDYLAARDAATCAPAYERLGLTVGVLAEGQDTAERRAAYDADVTYGADKQFIFDFLRDRLHAPLAPTVASSVLDELARPRTPKSAGGTGGARGGWASRVVQRGLFAAIVDEADSVLIDEAATPAIIALPAKDAAGGAAAPPGGEQLARALEVARGLAAGRHYTVDRRLHRVLLTRAGRDRLGQLAADLPPFWSGPRRREELVTLALSALKLHTRDDDYIVREVERDGQRLREVAIVDRSTGRVLEGRQWQLGLHQAVEAKEGLSPSERRVTAARVSYQRYFSRYQRLSGMSGTAWEVAGELWRNYALRVVRVPTHRPIARRQVPDRVVRTGKAKFEAIARAARRHHDAGRPVLVGTRSVADSEALARLLADRGLAADVLNARAEAAEAAIVERAGRAGAVTVATSMAGRGTDIKLDDRARAAGGLVVLAADRHHERRVDRQLFGRSGRQGDPGLARAFLALDDEVLVRYGPAWLRLAALASPGPLRRPLASVLLALSQRAATRRWRLIRDEAATIDAWIDMAFHQQSR